MSGSSTPTSDAPNTAPARQHRRGATSQSHNHRPALAQAGESVIGQFATSVTSRYSMSAWRVGTVHPHTIVGRRQAGSSREHHTRAGSGGATWVHRMAPSSKVAQWRCTVRTSCGAMSSQGHVVPNTAPARPHQRGATGQSHNRRPALAQAGESVVG